MQESGERKHPFLDVLKRLAKALKLKVGELVEWGHTEQDMGHAPFIRRGNWGIVVKKKGIGQWEAFVHRLPAPGEHGEYVAEGELVPGGPYQNKDAARAAGEHYVDRKQGH